MKRVYAYLPFLAWILASSVSEANVDLCEYYKQFYPAQYESMCGGGKKGGSGSTNMAQSSSFRRNPARLATSRTAYGLETQLSELRDEPGDFYPYATLLKGFQRVGAGLSTGYDNTFYNNDVLQRAYGPPNLETFQEREGHKRHLPSVDGGLGVDLLSSKAKGVSLELGGEVKYNGVTDTFGGGTGLALDTSHLSLEVGLTRERIASDWGSIYFFSTGATARVFMFEIQYLFLKNAGGAALNPIHLVAVSTGLGRFLFTGAVRWLDYLSTGEVYQKHGSVQFRVSRHLTLGYMYNYIPGAHTAAFQFYL